MALQCVTMRTGYPCSSLDATKPRLGLCCPRMSASVFLLSGACGTTLRRCPVTATSTRPRAMRSPTRSTTGSSRSRSTRDGCGRIVLTPSMHVGYPNGWYSSAGAGALVVVDKEQVSDPPLDRRVGEGGSTTITREPASARIDGHEKYIAIRIAEEQAVGRPQIRRTVVDGVRRHALQRVQPVHETTDPAHEDASAKAAARHQCRGAVGHELRIDTGDLVVMSDGREAPFRRAFLRLTGPTRPWSGGGQG
jgi:hypothetical protein